MADLRAYGIDEPLVTESLRGGADLVSFSGDKLMGGPQAGILAGKADLVARLRRNPLFRALRADKLIYQALEATLRNLVLERWSKVPALAMIAQAPEEVYRRAEALLTRFPDVDADILPGKSVIGGGATPDQTLDTWLIAPQHEKAADAERLLRRADPPVIGRIEAERLVLDLRTVLPGEEDFLGQALTMLARATG